MTAFAAFFLSLTLAVAGLLIAVSVSLLVLRAASLVKAYAAAMALGLATWSGAFFALAPSDPLEFFSGWTLGALIYLSFAYLFFHFLNIPLTSVRLQILGRIYRGETVDAEILQSASEKNPIEIRIERLLASGQLAESPDGRLRLGPATPWMLRICLCFDLLRRVLAVRS